MAGRLIRTDHDRFDSIKRHFAPLERGIFFGFGTINIQLLRSCDGLSAVLLLVVPGANKINALRAL